jgi:hypothetical protein
MAAYIKQVTSSKRLYWGFSYPRQTDQVSWGSKSYP